MGGVKDAKTLGGIGAILNLFIPIVGIILIFIALKYISEETKDESIYKNALYFIIFGIIGFAAWFVTIFTLGFFPIFTVIASPFAAFFSILIGLLIALITFIFVILAIIYLKKSLDTVATKFINKWFKYAALLLLIGAITLILGIGVFIMFIGNIFLIIAFFTLPEVYKPPEAPAEAVPPPPS